MLEGSVRKAGGRVRITAQLIDGATGGHVWAERYDRDLNDIFALQDEISQAIVAALKLKLLPEEKKAIEQRGTTNVEAYNLYLMARQIQRHRQPRQRPPQRSDHPPVPPRDRDRSGLCASLGADGARADEPALASRARRRRRLGRGRDGRSRSTANLAEAHAAKARILTQDGRFDEARREIDIALRLDPESYEVNSAAASLH